MNYRPMEYTRPPPLPTFGVRTTDLWGTRLPTYEVHAKSLKALTRLSFQGLCKAANQSLTIYLTPPPVDNSRHNRRNA